MKKLFHSFRQVAFSFQLCALSILPCAFSYSQVPVDDPGLNGQFERMTLTKWNDWQPNPGTTWGVIPKDLTGFMFWRILNNSYYKGNDKRPYVANPATGQFAQNLAGLELTNVETQEMADSLKKVALQQAANMVNMMGGVADVSWDLYFGKKFDEIWNDYQKPFNNLKQSAPAAWLDMQNDGTYQDFAKQYQSLQDRVNSIHQATMEKGARLVAYFNIIKDCEKLSSTAAIYCNRFNQRWKAQDLKNRAKNAKPSFANNATSVLQNVTNSIKL